MRKDFLNGSCVEKELTLTIRVPQTFDENMKRRIDEALSDTLYNLGCELVDSKEYRDVSEKAPLLVNHVTLVRERLSENETWADNFWVDANKTPSVELFKEVVEEYLRTPDGLKDIEGTCYDFNWGDAIMYVPLASWESHGIYNADDPWTLQMKGLTPNLNSTGVVFDVDQDEVLIPADLYDKEKEPSLLAGEHGQDGSSTLDNTEKSGAALTNAETSVKLWVRAGMTLEVPLSVYELLQQGNAAVMHSVLTGKVGQAYLDGETYFPDIEQNGPLGEMDFNLYSGPDATPVFTREEILKAKASLSDLLQNAAKRQEQQHDQMGSCKDTNVKDR